MIRPLVWLGIAYGLGEGAALLGIPPAVVLVLTLGVVFYTGRRHISTNFDVKICLLPVFFMLGFILFSKSYAPLKDLTRQRQGNVVFAGRIESIYEKKGTLLLRLSKSSLYPAEVEKEGTAAAITYGGKRKNDMLLYVDLSYGDSLREGYSIKGHGKARSPERATVPGQFDAGIWYLSQGVDTIVYGEEIQITKKAATYRAFLGELRRRAKKVFSELFDDETAGILDAMLLGDRILLEEDIKELFRILGISHILAISGLHISLIGHGLYRLLRKLGAGIHLSVFLCSFTVLSYGVLSGMSASTTRAVIMFLIFMGAEYTGKGYDSLSAMSVALLIMFIRRPLLICQSGVCFSYSAVAALGALWPAMRGLLPAERRKSRRVSALGSAAAVILLSMPLTAINYGQISLLALPVNLLILPAIGFVLPLALLTAITGLISLSLAALPAGGLRLMISLAISLCEKLSKLPFAILWTGCPPAALTAFFYIAVTVFVISSALLRKYGGAKYFSIDLPGMRLETKSLKICLWILLAFSLLIILIPFRRMERFAEFLDVGQGDCIFFRSKNTSWLIDGGSRDVKEVGRYRIIPFLNYYGEEKLDYALVSHCDGDHISGIRELLEASLISHLVLTEACRWDEKSRELAEFAREKGADVLYIGAGDSFSDGDFKISCLYPGRDEKEGDSNDLSMVLRIDEGDLSCLMTGDISAETEIKLLEIYGGRDRAELEDIDILKCPHHGSAGSSSEEFLERLKPSLTLISCSLHNNYGHPSPEAIGRIRGCGSRAEYTMYSGSIKIKVRRGRIWIRRFSGNS